MLAGTIRELRHDIVDTDVRPVLEEPKLDSRRR
jgi:hypothetical protein